MGKTYRRTKNFNDYQYVDAWFEDFDHTPFEIPSWASSKLKRQLRDIKILKEYIHSDRWRSNDRCHNFVKKESNKIVRNEKRKLIHKAKKDHFVDTPKSNNKKNSLYMMYIY